MSYFIPLTLAILTSIWSAANCQYQQFWQSNTTSPSHVGRFRIDISTVRLLHQVDRRFLSVALDAHDLYKWWKDVDLANERFIILTSYLRPAYLRIGGSDADMLKFSSEVPPLALAGMPVLHDERKTNLQYEHKLDTKCRNPMGLKTFYGVHLLKLIKFIKKTQLDLVFGLNLLLRNHSHWNSTNAKELIVFLSKRQIKVAGWELGNEPNLFPFNFFNTTVHPSRAAADFCHLRSILNKFPLYRNSLIIGPDITQPSYRERSKRLPKPNKAAVYMKSFLKHIKNPNCLDAVSFHHYYFDGHKAITDDFLNTTIMDELKDVIQLTQNITSQYIPGKDCWIGETSSAWGGGAPNISNTFADSFMWLNKLGQSALTGIKVVVRETLTSSSYGLITKELDPTPDYFVSLLYKRFVGEKVLSFNSSLVWYHHHATYPTAWNGNGSELRVYAHCAKMARLDHAHSSNDVNRVTPGAVTIFGINPSKNQTYVVEVQGQAGTTIKQYLLQSPGNQLTSTIVNLNGKLLTIDKTNKYPRIKPIEQRHVFQIPRLSLGFWVLDLANAVECL